jgi:hypothetical protein
VNPSIATVSPSRTVCSTAAARDKNSAIRRFPKSSFFTGGQGARILSPRATSRDAYAFQTGKNRNRQSTDCTAPAKVGKLR